MTALRIEVPPADPAKARHSPEKGFVVNRIDAWAVQPDGKTGQDRVPLAGARIRCENLQGNIARLLRNAGSNRVRHRR